jgi:hypothetical protein
LVSFGIQTGVADFDAANSSRFRGLVLLPAFPVQEIVKVISAIDVGGESIAD